VITRRSKTVRLRIQEQNREKFDAALKEVNGRGRTRRLNAEDVFEAAEIAEGYLEDAGRRRIGATAIYQPWRVPNSYDYVAHGSRLVMHRSRAGWVLDEVLWCPVPSSRGGVLPRHGGLRLTLPPEPQADTAA